MWTPLAFQAASAYQYLPGGREDDGLFADDVLAVRRAEELDPLGWPDLFFAPTRMESAKPLYMLARLPLGPSRRQSDLNALHAEERCWSSKSRW